MQEKALPPKCFSCSKDFKDSLESLHYCICDIALCDDCINSAKKSESKWVCPNCGAENSLMTSKLIRE